MGWFELLEPVVLGRLEQLELVPMVEKLELLVVKHSPACVSDILQHLFFTLSIVFFFPLPFHAFFS